MKNNTIVWQLITAILGLLLIMSIRTYLLDNNEIVAETNRAQCFIEATGKGLEINICSDIHNYKLKGSAYGN